MARLLHMAEGGDNVGGGEAAARQRRQGCGVEHPGQLAKEAAGERWPYRHELVGVDREVADIVPERT